jgi:hypothetical protein
MKFKESNVLLAVVDKCEFNDVRLLVPRCECRFNVASDVTNEGLVLLHVATMSFVPRPMLPSF